MWKQLHLGADVSASEKVDHRYSLLGDHIFILETTMTVPLQPLRLYGTVGETEWICNPTKPTMQLVHNLTHAQTLTHTTITK